MNETLSVERVAALLSEETFESPPKLHVYWLRVDQERHSYRDRLSERIELPSVLPLVVNIDGFQNPNAILTDLVRVVSEHRDKISDRLEGIDEDEPIVILLVARGELAVPQASSPVSLPSWFPQVGGRTIECFIKDAATVLQAALNSPEVNVDAIQWSLYQLEGTLVERILRVVEDRQRQGDRLMGIVREEVEEDLGLSKFLRLARDNWKGVENPRSYRVSLREADGLFALLLRAFSRRSPDSVRKVGQALADALDIDVKVTHDSEPCLTDVLLRAPRSRESGVKLWSTNLLRTAFVAHQITTAAAHADDYPAYPIVLLKNLSRDLRSRLAALRQSIELLSES